MKTYSTADVAHLSGASYRQLDYWARTRLLVPSVEAKGSGTQRRYTETQLADVQIIVALIAAGVSLTTVRRYGPRQTAERLAKMAERILAGAA